MAVATNTAKEKTEFICTFDIETYGLEPVYGVVLCAVVKPLNGELKVLRQKRPSSDDSQLVFDIINELNQYNILIAHNGLYFDKQFLNGRALHWNQDILEPNVKIIDPCIVARKNLNLRSNSLDSIAQYLGLDEQKMHLDPIIWKKAALDHDEPCMKTLIERCSSDVRVLELLAKRVMKLTRNITPWGSA